MTSFDDFVNQVKGGPQDGGEAPTSKDPQSFANFMARVQSTPAVPNSSASNFNPQSGNSDMDTMLSGAGRAFVKLGAGIAEAASPLYAALEQHFPGAAAWAQSHGVPSDAALQDDARGAVQTADTLGAPLQHGYGAVGGTLGDIAMSAPAFMAAGPGVLANGVAGGVMGYLAPAASEDQRLRDMTGGALMGAGAAKVLPLLGRIVKPFGDAIDPLRQKAVAVLDAAAVPLEAAQRTGATILQRLRSGTYDNPITSGAQADYVGAQSRAYNRAVLSTIGANSTAATPDVMNEAAKRIGSVFDDILPKANIPLTPELASDVAAIHNNALAEEKTGVANKAQQLLDAADQNGVVPGRTAYAIKKDLDRMASSADSSLSYHAKQLRSTIMDAATNQLSPEDAAKFSEARAQFRRMKQIEPAIAKDGSGNISAPRLASAMSTAKNRAQTLYGRGDQTLVDLAHAGNLLLPDRMPNSGTAGRHMMQLLWPAVAAGIGGATHGDMGAVAAGVAGETMPRAIQMAVQNPTISRYLANGMQDGTLSDLLNLPKNNAAVGASLRSLLGSYIHATQSRPSSR